MKYFIPIMSILMIITLHSNAARAQQETLIEPESIDPTMTSVAYTLESSDIRIVNYKTGSVNTLDLLLCKSCKITRYTISESAELLHQDSVTKQSSIAQLLAKKFKYIQVGLNRTTKEITFMNFSNQNSESSILQDQWVLKEY